MLTTSFGLFIFYQMLYLTHISNIDLIPHDHFKTKQNLYCIQMNMHLMHGLYFYTYLGYYARFFFKINKYQLLYRIFAILYAHAGTLLTMVKN